MKKVFLSIPILILLIAYQTKDKDEQIATMLKIFYTNYITAISEFNMQKMDSYLDSLKKVYCTPKLLKGIQNEFERGELGYDPFINAQDADKECLQTLTIKKDTLIPYYNVSYKESYSGITVNIKLKIEKENDSIKITDIW